MGKDFFKLISIGLILFATGFVLKSLTVAQSSAQVSDDDPSHLTFVTSDGLSLHAWLSPARTDTTPGLALLMPMLSKTHDSYQPFIGQLNDIGYTTIAFDMRGHGQSTRCGKQILSYADMDKTQFGRLPDDIEEFFLDFKKNHPDACNYDDVVLIGASIGANTAGLLMSREWTTRAVLLSPGRNYRGLKPETVMAGNGGKLTKPVYLAVAEADTYSAESSQWLSDNYSGPIVFKKYPGKFHGTDILHNIENAGRDLLAWLQKR